MALHQSSFYDSGAGHAFGIGHVVYKRYRRDYNLRQLQSIGYTADLARTMMGDYSAQAVTMWNVPPALIYHRLLYYPLISAAMKMGQTERQNHHEQRYKGRG